MYAYISGKLVSIGENCAVLDNGGIGYNITISGNTLTELPKLGNEVKLFIFQHVKEDGISLYGFLNEAEKQMFLRLITISGVGPKMAIGILSGASIKTLSRSILSGDTSTLSKIKGIGKKTAERIILELKESIGEDKLMLSASAGNAMEDTLVSDSVDALEALGMPRSEVYE
ncbi:MAG: Holliday junction branch migration protein RuvA, partial [Clostridia bacterium]|nr:Holliday junction branch migration protein RuvA [Clostridia bacterium]